MYLLAVSAPLFCSLPGPVPLAQLDCDTQGAVITITPGSQGQAYLKATEQEAIDSAIGAVSPDSCKRCPSGQSGCSETNTWNNASFVVVPHQHPNGQWSAEATVSATDGSQPITVQTQCSPCA